MIKIKCAICNHYGSDILYKENFKPGQINEVIFSARRLPDKLHYQIVKCKKCGLVYSNPIFTSVEINNLYKKSKFNYTDFESDLRYTYSKYLKKFIKFLPQQLSFLEIGCGNGFFLEEARKLGFKNVRGVEPSSDSINKASPSVRNKIIEDVFKKGQFKANSFDLICLFQVLDHFTDPDYVLKEAFRILKPEGGIYCICHNVGSLQAKILMDKSPIIDIEHIYLFDKETLGKLFTNNKFKVKEVFSVSNQYPLDYWLQLLPIPNSLKDIIRKILKKTGISQLRLTIPAGNMGIFVQKPA